MKPKITYEKSQELPKIDIEYTDETETELLALSRLEASRGLTSRERLFCELFITNHNGGLSVMKAGYKHGSVATASSFSWRLRQRYNIKRYLAWLSFKLADACFVKAVDIIDQYTRIAFADMNDFVVSDGRRIKLNDSKMIDGQLVKTIRQTKDGATIELHDKLQALGRLEKYFKIMPKDWKQELEERKIEILEKRLELDKLKAGQFEIDDCDDGFIEALQGVATEVWEDEDTIEEAKE